MSVPPAQKFHLERTDLFYGTVDEPTLACLRATTDTDESRHAAFLTEIKAKASRFIESGSKSRSPLYASFCSDTLWHLRYGNPHPKTKIVDDRLHRFLWARDYITCSLRRFEIRLTLAECSLQDENRKPLFAFVDGRVQSYPALDFGETALSIWEDELAEKVLQMNPSWTGALEVLVQALVNQHHLGYQTSNIKDWPIESVFSQSANYLYSLLEEINRAVFNGIGQIKDDLWEDEPGKGAAKGFSLYIPKNNWNPNNLGRIGLRENGKFEIRIRAEREKQEYWDTDLRGVIDTLQQAIIWWKECGEFTEEERIQQEEDMKRAKLEREAKGYPAGS